MSEFLDASAIDGLDDFELSGEVEDLPSATQSEEPDTTQNQNQDQNPEPNNEETPKNQEDSSTTSEEPSENLDDFVNEILRIKGISDPSKIKFEDESGAIIERDWKSLSTNEKLNIVANGEDPERDLEEDEIQFINMLRENKVTPQQYVQYIQQQAAQAAIDEYDKKQVPVYEIDSLSDDELYALDLLEKVGEENITDEELQEALENAKANETLYAKQIEGLRTKYKNLEDQQKYDAEQEQAEQIEQRYQEFSNQVLNEIGSFNSFANQEIELSTDDKNDIANYILTRRDSGVSDFYADMQNPATATLAAFWLLRGPEVLNEMESQIKAAYQRGFNLGKAQTTSKVTPKTPQVVVQDPKPAATSNIDLQSAFGLGDESYLYN